MKPQVRIHYLAAVGVLVGCLVGGCAGSPHGETEGLGLSPTPEGSLGGTGYYQVENAYAAQFVNCTGQAAILEGLTFAGGYVLAPICLASGYFDVIQNGNTLSVVPHQVACSDGSSGMVSGVADVGADALNGAWESTSEAGVLSSQVFSGTMSGSSIQILENRLTFGGTFEGECTFDPPLSGTLTVI